MIPKLDQPEDENRINWIEKYVIEISFTINKDGDPTFKIVYISENEEHLIITDGPTLRAAIDRAMLTTHAQQS